MTHSYANDSNRHLGWTETYHGGGSASATVGQSATGNRDTYTNVNGVVFDYLYDASDRMVEMKRSGATRVTMAHNAPRIGFGLRPKRSIRACFK